MYMYRMAICCYVDAKSDLTRALLPQERFPSSSSSHAVYLALERLQFCT